MNKAKVRYFTKSAFKVATECATKLNYLKKPVYWSNKQENAFLKALADGGFQVGELAKVYWPNGIQINTLDYDRAIELTNEALKQPNVTIYEAAFEHNGCFIRSDIIIKRGSLIDLIEVKAKSYDGGGNEEFWTKGNSVNSKWEPYLFDVAFQKWVVSQAKPEFVITPYLMLADKTATAEIDGINQKFSLISDPSEPMVRVRVAPGTTEQSLGSKLLKQIRVEREVDHLLSQQYGNLTFAEYVSYLSDKYERDERVTPVLSRVCRECEYRISSDKEAEGFKSGFKQCWSEAANFTPRDFDRPLILDIWRLHYTKKDRLLSEQRYFMSDLNPGDIAPKTEKRRNEEETDIGLSNQDRQWKQIEYSRKNNMEPYLDVDGLVAMFSQFTYPLHFIDFETTRAAIPFHRGRRPYEQIAFQFSEHLVYEDGSIEHKSQYLSFERGKFPNYDFVRELKKALSTDQGTIFRYADHENTVLREIHRQLKTDLAPPADADELCTWIDSITREKIDKGSYREGPRCMVDLKWLVQKFFFHPATQGSNSIKAILPAVLDSSLHLQEKYSKPIYGASGGIQSLNFKNQTWVSIENETVLDPYKCLQPVFLDLELPEESLYEDDERIAEGGAAMTAYARMQFTEMPDSERQRVAEALLRYCELDTLAMVMVYEYWKDELKIRHKKAA